MRLHLPVLIKWLNNQTTIEKCRSCRSFSLETIRHDGEKGYDGIYLRCGCRAIPRLLLTRLDLEQCTNIELKDLLVGWLQAKKGYWNKLVRYFAISTKTW
jgi:hypothetical protein